MLVAGWLACICYPGFTDSASFFCYSPSINIPGGGGTATANVTCGIYTSGSGSNYHLMNSNDNFLTPASLVLVNGTHQLSVIRQTSVVSPDNTVTSIAGTSSGFTGDLLNTTSLKTLQFQYAITTTAQTAPGLYSSYASTSYYQYRICSSESCEQHVFTGTAPVSLSVNVQSSPVTVSCASPAVNATPGGGSFTLDVTCTLSGNSAKQFSPSNQNLFSPSTITLTNGKSTLAATLQPTVTSPDSSVSALSGTASGGFTGTINSLPAKIKVQYQGNTTLRTTAGAYTSAPVTFTWSTI